MELKVSKYFKTIYNTGGTLMTYEFLDKEKTAYRLSVGCDRIIIDKFPNFCPLGIGYETIIDFKLEKPILPFKTSLYEIMSLLYHDKNILITFIDD